MQRLKSDVRIVGRKSGRHSDISLRPQSILSCNRPLVLFTFTVRCCPLLTNSLTLIFIKSQETYKESYLYDSMWDRQLVQMVLVIPAYDFSPVGEGVMFLPKGNREGSCARSRLHDSADLECRGPVS